MATFDYAGLRDIADSLLVEFGQAVTIRRVSNSGGSDWQPTQETSDVTTVGVITNLPRWYPAYIDNSDVLRTDRLGYVAAGPLGDFVPTPFDRLIDAIGRTWKIIDAKPIYPGGTSVVYILQLRI